MHRRVNEIHLLISIAIAQGFGFISAIATGAGNDVYHRLVLPPFAPPSWVFPLMLFSLNLCVGVAAYIIYSSHNRRKNEALVMYMGLMLANVIWFFLFIYMNMIFLSLALMFMVLILLYSIHKLFKTINAFAGYLVIPYFVWVIIMIYLTIGIWLLNHNNVY